MAPPATVKNEKLIDAVKGFENVPWCDQYERMLSGMRYDASDPMLAASRYRARVLQGQYNNMLPSFDSNRDDFVAERNKILKSLLGKTGTDFYMESLQVDYGCNIIIGEGFYANYNCVILDCSLVTIGDRVMFAPGVSIFTATHETDVESRRQGIEYAAPVAIGNDCWIGGNVTILPGVTIGDGCTIGAGSVVTKDIPAYSVAVGNPARVVKQVEKPNDA